MIPDIQFSVLCDDVRQEINGHFQFLGVFGDGIAVKQFPFRLFRFCIANRWVCGQGDFKQKTTIFMPDGKTPFLQGREVKIHLQNGAANHTSIEQFLGTEFKEAGTYWIEVNLDGELRARYPFTVRLAPTPAQPTPEAPTA